MNKMLEDSKLLKLNLGCGLCAPEDWINIDTSYMSLLSKCGWLHKMSVCLEAVK